MGSLKFRSSSRLVAFLAVMAALGNVLSGLTIGLSKVGQVGIDFSHVATFVAAIYGGPLLGFLSGMLGGVAAGVYFGPLSGLSWLGLIGLPLGKSLAGLTTGFLFRAFRVREKSHVSLLTVPMVLLGYVPEAVFIVAYFMVLVPYFFGWSSVPLLISILVKAWIEIAFMSVLMGALAGNSGFASFISTFFTLPGRESNKRTRTS